MRNRTSAFFRLVPAAILAAGIAFVPAPASAGGGHGWHDRGWHGHGRHRFHHGRHGHFHAPPYRHHRHHRGGTGLSFTFISPPAYYERRPVYGYRTYAPPVRAVPPPAYATACSQGAWRHPDGYIERGVACRGPDGYWRMAN